MEASEQAAAQGAALELLAALLRVGGATMSASLRTTADVAALHSSTTAEAAVEVCCGAMLAPQCCCEYSTATVFTDGFVLRFVLTFFHCPKLPHCCGTLVLSTIWFSTCPRRAVCNLQALQRGQDATTAPARRLQLAAYGALAAASTVPGQGSRSTVLPAAVALLRRGAQDASPKLASLSSQVLRRSVVMLAHYLRAYSVTAHSSAARRVLVVSEGQVTADCR